MKHFVYLLVSLHKKNEVSILTRINKNNWNNKTNIQLEIVDVICLSNNA